MKEEPQDKRTAALQATLKLIAEQGFHATPMSQIAQQANISVGTIYHYFSSKEELINELYIYLKIRLNQVIRNNCLNNGNMQEQNFISASKSLYKHYLANPNELLFMEQYSNSPLITEAYHEKIRQLFEPQEKAMEQAIKNNILKDLPLEMINALLHGAMHSLIKFCLSNKDNISEEDMDRGFKAMWDMIKK